MFQFGRASAARRPFNSKSHFKTTVAIITKIATSEAAKVMALKNTYASERSSVAVLAKSRWNAARTPEFA